ncbi:MAG: hypothetical protein WEF86_10865 [Gemmatimonadota bacterium]
MKTAFAAMTAAALLVQPGTADARAQATQTRCGYDECALRISPGSFTTPPALLRGRDGARVTQLGLFQEAVTPHFARSDSARAYALEYDRLYDRGGVLSSAGTVIAVLAPIILDGTMRRIVFTAVGVGVSVYGGVVTKRADDALSTAVWWHNRDLRE